MNFSPTSRTLFVIQILEFTAATIVVACTSLFIQAGSSSGIISGTLAFAVLNIICSLFFAIRQKGGRTVRSWMEAVWVILALALWVLAAIGGIAKAPFTGISCHGDDVNTRACQSSFASTAFCIVSAFLFLAHAIVLLIFSIQGRARAKKAEKVRVGGSYNLAPTPSQYRRQEQSESGSAAVGATTAATATAGATAAGLAAGAAVSTPAQTHSSLNLGNDAAAEQGGLLSSYNLPENVYQDPAPPPTPPRAPTNPPSMTNINQLHQAYPSSSSSHHSSSSQVAPGLTSEAGTAAFPANSNNSQYQYQYPQQQQQQQHQAYPSNGSYYAQNGGPSNGHLGGGGGHSQQASNMSAHAYDGYNPASYPQTSGYGSNNGSGYYNSNNLGVNNLNGNQGSAMSTLDMPNPYYSNGANSNATGQYYTPGSINTIIDHPSTSEVQHQQLGGQSSIVPAKVNMPAPEFYNH